MITPSKRHLGFIILIILLFSEAIKFSDFCFDDTDFFIIGSIAVLFFINFLVVTFYNLYHVSIKKEFFDFFPLVALLVFATIFYIAIMYPALDFNKKKYQVYENQDINIEKLILKLYDDGTFAYQKKVNDQQCIYKGEYQFTKKQLSLYFENKDLKTIDYTFDDNNNLVLENDTLFSLVTVKKLKKN